MLVAASHDLVGLALQPPSLVGAQSSHILRDMLQRGFTTVRGAAGAGFGRQAAGHADMQLTGVEGRGLFCSRAGPGLVGAIADGVGEVRRAVREQVRQGANHIRCIRLRCRAGGSCAAA